MARTSVFLTFVFLVSFKNGLGQDTNCNDNGGMTSVYNAGFCYFLYQEESYVTWQKALENCQEIGADLASFHSAAEMEFVQMRLMNTSKLTTQIWIGMNGSQEKKLYKWSDKTEVTYIRLNLNESQPNTKDEICVYMKKADEMWNMADCEMQMQFLCKAKSKNAEIQNVSVTKMSNSCPPEWRQFGNKCYKVFGDEGKKKKWSDVEESCQHQNVRYSGSSITLLPNITEQGYLTDLLKDCHFDVWIGLQNEENITDDLKSDNDTFEKGHNCIAAMFKEHKGIQWSYDNCGNKKGYICQTYLSSGLYITATERGKDGLPFVDSLHPGFVIAAIMGSVLGMFLLSTVGFIAYKRSRTSQPHRLFSVRNRVFNHRRLDLQTLI